MEEKEIVLSIRLVGTEVDLFDTGIKKAGVRTNSEFIRFLIKQYAKD